MVFNDPAGMDFITHGENSCSVEIHFDDRFLRRTRSKDENVYSLDGTELKAFGREVPEIIAKELNINPVSFQKQLDSTFWFGLSSGQVSQEINNIIDLSQIDRVTSLLNSDIRKSKSKIEYLTDKVKTGRDFLRDHKWVGDADDDLRHLERLSDSLKAKVERVNKLRAVIEALDKQIVAQKVAEEALRESFVWQTKADTVVTMQRKIKKLEGMIDEYQQKTLSRNEAMTQYQNLQKKLKDVIGQRCPVCLSEIKR